MVEAYGLISAYTWLWEKLPFFLIVLHAQGKIISCSAQSFLPLQSGELVANLEPIG